MVQVIGVDAAIGIPYSDRVGLLRRLKNTITKSVIAAVSIKACSLYGSVGSYGVAKVPPLEHVMIRAEQHKPLLQLFCIEPQDVNVGTVLHPNESPHQT